MLFDSSLLSQSSLSPPNTKGCDVSGQVSEGVTIRTPTKDNDSRWYIMSHYLTALMASVLQPLGAFFPALTMWIQQIVKPKQPVMNGLHRTRKIRQYMGINDGGPFESGPREVSLAPQIVDVPFFQLDDTKLVQMFGEAFGPELERLKGAEPTAEIGAEKTPGNLGKRKNQSPSRLLYGSDYAEINRSIVGVLALKWVVNGEWEVFSKYQKRDRIDEQAFQELRKFVLEYLKDSEALYALVIATIVNDLGKNKSLIETISTAGIDNLGSLNHDQIMYRAAQNIEIFKEFPDENPVQQALLLGLQFGAELNVPQFIQAENVPGSLRAVSLLKDQVDALHIKFLEILFDVAGAAGHSDSRCALMMSQYVWMSYHAAGEILKDILRHKLSYREGYDKFLDVRGSILENAGFRRLNVKDPVERALLRLLTMGRVTDPVTAKLFDAAFRDLDPEIRSNLVDGLSVDGVNDGTAIIPYYFPAVFANTLRNFAKQDDDAKVAALGALYRFLTRVLAGTKPKPEAGKDLVVECSLEFAQKVVKSDEFQQNPLVLDDLEVPQDAYSVPRAKWV